MYCYLGKQNIVNRPITVRLFAPNLPDLTLVDLPGLVEVCLKISTYRTDTAKFTKQSFGFQNPAGDQPVNIKEQVEHLVRSYIENPNAIILAVHPATTDLANGKSLKIAREVDPEGNS